MCNEAKLGHLLLLGPFGMLKAWWAWTLIMMKWLGLALGRLEPYDHLVFAWNGLTLSLEGMYFVNFWPLMLIMRIHLWWAQVVGLEWFKKWFWVFIPIRVQSQAFELEFIHNIQGSNNYDGLKRWTWVIIVQTTSIHM